MGDPRRAEAMVGLALKRTGRDRLPRGRREILAFAHTNFEGEIVATVGPRDFATFLDELDEDLGKAPLFAESDLPRSSASGSRPITTSAFAKISVLIVHPDRLVRAGLARALLIGGCDVTTLDPDTGEGLADAAHVDVIVAYLRGGAGLLSAAVHRFPEASLVVLHRGDAVGTEGMLHAAGVVRTRLVDASISNPALVTLIRSLRAG